VPPACIFPEAKDSKGIDYRRQLITVPSCSDHNLRSSSDDEYFLASIVASWKNNSTATRQFTTKILRVMEKHKALATSLFGIRRRIRVNGSSTFAYQVDRHRVEREVEKIARGLYFNAFSEPFRGSMQIHLPALLRPDLTEIEGMPDLVDMGEEILRNVREEGENRSVFSFKIGKVPERLLTVLRMRFYEGFICLCTMRNLAL
jgi:hypothetical protein